MGFPGGSAGKTLPADAGDSGSTPGSGRSPGEGNGNPRQYSCLENPVDGGAWWATVHGMAKSYGLTNSTVMCIPWGETRTLDQACTIVSWLLLFISAAPPSPTSQLFGLGRYNSGRVLEAKWRLFPVIQKWGTQEPHRVWLVPRSPTGSGLTPWSSTYWMSEWGNSERNCWQGSGLPIINQELSWFSLDRKFNTFYNIWFKYQTLVLDNLVYFF